MFLLVASLSRLEKGSLVASAILFALSTHLRLFPVFLSLMILLHLGLRAIPFGVIACSVFNVLNLQFF
jgi:hypothetical protein